MPIMRNLTHTIQGEKSLLSCCKLFRFGTIWCFCQRRWEYISCLAVPCCLDSQKLYTYLGTKYLLVVAEIVEVKALTLYLTCSKMFSVRMIHSFINWTKYMFYSDFLEFARKLFWVWGWMLNSPLRIECLL